jgi:hypothetical protein
MSLLDAGVVEDLQQLRAPRLAAREHARHQRARTSACGTRGGTAVASETSVARSGRRRWHG